MGDAQQEGQLTQRQRVYGDGGADVAAQVHGVHDESQAAAFQARAQARVEGESDKARICVLEAESSAKDAEHKARICVLEAES